MEEKRIVLETKRLYLVLLTPHQSKLWTEELSTLEKELGCTYKAEAIDGDFRKIIVNQAEKAAKDPGNNLWHSFFLLVRKSDKIVVGSADYKHPPNEYGEVEIGYGLGREFEHMGYMTEAVKKMCEYALECPLVAVVIAETEMDNCASQRVLQRCGFKKFKEEETIWWQLY